jgi:glycerol kinase
MSINDLLKAMVLDTGLPIKSLKVDGGASANSLLMELQATISKVLIVRPKITETTALGAAMASAIGAGLIDMDHLQNTWKKDCEFSVNKGLSEYIDKKLLLWDKNLNNYYGIRL